MPEPTTLSPSVSEKPQRRRWRFGLLALVVLGGVAVWWFAIRQRVPDPPEIHAQDGADPAVIQLIAGLRNDVLANRKSSEKWGELGLAFGAHGYESEANACFAVAERFNPQEPRWPYLQGVFLITTGPPEAPDHLARALRLEPRDPVARGAVRMRLAETLLDLQRIEEADALVQTQARQFPQDPRARLANGRIAMMRGDRRTATREFTQLADGPFTRKRAHIQLAALAREEGNLAEAAAREQAVRNAPEDLPWPDPYIRDVLSRNVGLQSRIGEAERIAAGGDLPRATAMLVALAQSDPTPRVLSAAAMNLTKLREYSQAEEMLRECLRRQPGHSQAEYFLSVVLFERAESVRGSRPEEAKSLCREAARHGRLSVEAKPDHGLAWLYLGRSLLGIGEDLGGAVEALRQAVAIRPEFVDPHMYLAEALFLTGQKAEAIKHARNGEELAGPGDPRPRQLLEKLGEKPRPDKR